MRILIVDTDYRWFLDWLYAQHPGLATASYETQMRVRLDSQFSCGGSYPANLGKLGHEAFQVFANNDSMQMAWAREHSLNISPRLRWEFRLRRRLVPWVSRVIDDRWLYEILRAQIKHYKPDVLLNNDMHLRTAFFREIKPCVRLLLASHGSPLPADREFSVYDLVLSVVKNFVDYFREQGVNSELLRLAFEPTVLERLDQPKHSIPISFVGQLSRDHAFRQRWLEHICDRLPVEVWAPSTDGLSEDSPVKRCYQGTVWGIEMYAVLHRSHMTLNHHIDVAGPYAGNARLFEATGVGTLLVTDWKKNLHEMFEPGKEVVCYRTPEECTEMIQYYLEHHEEREVIARAGQQRTLREHTYYQRMQEFSDIVHKYL